MRSQTPEQAARNILSRMDIDGAQSFSAGEVAEIANILVEVIEQETEIKKLRSMCKAAAAEIASAWEAHCDEDGCGPVNLMARLEGKLPPDLYSAFDDQ